MRIGKLAAATGSTPRLLRYYEEQGLLRPTRSPNGYREYGDHLVAKVQRIRELIAVGMPTALILQVLPCFEDDDTIYQVTPSAEVLERLLEHRERLDAKLGCIQGSRDAIDVYLHRVGGIVV